MQEAIANIVLGGLVAVSIFILMLLFRRYAIIYRLTDESMQVMVLRVISVSRTRYEHIREVRRASLSEVLLYAHAINWSNKLLGPFMPIYRRYWFPMIVTPEDSEEFVRELRRRAQERTGQSPWVS